MDDCCIYLIPKTYHRSVNGPDIQRLSQNTVEFLNILQYTFYQSSQVGGWVEHFETNWNSMQTSLYNNFWMRSSNFSKSSYNKNTRKKILFIAIFQFTISFLRWAISKYHLSHSQCRVPFFQPIWPWLSFQIWPEEDCWKMCGIRWLPHYLTQIGNHRDASSGLEKAKIRWYEIWRVRRIKWQFNIGVLRYSYTSRTVWGYALSCCKIHWFFNFGCFQIACHHRIFKTLRWYFLLTVTFGSTKCR